EQADRRGKQPAPEEVLSESEQQQLRRQLGWYGDLALGPKGADPADRARALAPARRAAVGIIVWVTAVLVLGVFGLTLWFVLAFLWFKGQVRSGLQAAARARPGV